MQNKWIYSPDAKETYTVRNKDFFISWENYGIELVLRVDKYHDISGKSGMATIGDISVSISFKTFEETNYINIIHTITNNGDTSHIVDIGFHSDIAIEGSDGTDGDHCPTRIIDRNRGVEFKNGDRIVRFLLRDFPYVTNVDTYSYAHCTPYNLWENCSSYDDMPYGAGIHFSWQNIMLYSHETKNYSYSIGMGEYNPEIISNTIKTSLFNDPKYYFREKVPGFHRKR